jgi:hypothetical protein
MPNSCSSFPYPYPESIQTSLYILGFTGDVAPSSLKELNKRYHLLALKHHPDKNINSESEEGEGEYDNATEKFKEINDAHKRVRDYFYSGCSTVEQDTEINMDTGYDSILQLFIKTIIVKITAASPLAPDSNAIQSLIHGIITKGIQSSVKLFRSMDKHTSLMIYDILSKNQELFGISREIMDELTSILEEKTSADMVVRLNPSLLDMLLDRVYILNESGHSYYIPLWHSELHFKRRVSTSAHTNEEPEQEPEPDISGEIIVLCEPELPDNVSIDEDNNIYISLDINIQELFIKQVLPVVINDDNGFVYYLHACDVTLQSSSAGSSSNPGRQRILLRSVSGVAGAGGIAKWNNHQGGGDMYKVGQRANVYANIRLVV